MEIYLKAVGMKATKASAKIAVKIISEQINQGSWAKQNMWSILDPSWSRLSLFLCRYGTSLAWMTVSETHQIRNLIAMWWLLQDGARCVDAAVGASLVSNSKAHKSFLIPSESLQGCSEQGTSNLDSILSYLIRLEARSISLGRSDAVALLVQSTLVRFPPQVGRCPSWKDHCQGQRQPRNSHGQWLGHRLCSSAPHCDW